MPVSDATLLAITNLSVGTPVTDETDFTAMTPAEVAAKYELWSRGSVLYAPDDDSDYLFRDTDEPAVTDAGLWPVGATTQHIYDSTFTGAVAGTIGSGGALPDGWNINSFASQGLACDVLANGTAFGLPTLKWRIYGTLTATEASYVTMAQSFRPITPGQTATFSVLVRLIAGTSPTVKNQINFFDAGNVYINGSETNRFDTFTAEWEAYTINAVAPALSASFELYAFRVIGDVDDVVDFTIEICAPMLSLARLTAGDTIHIPTDTNADATHLSEITQREVAVWKPFVVVIEATTGEDKANWPVLYQLSKDASNSLMVVQHPGGWIGVVYYNAGVGVSAYSSAVPDNTPFKFVLNVTATKIRAVLTVDSVQETLTLDIVRYGGVSILETVGSNWGGGQHWNGPIQSCTLIHPAVYIDAQLEAA